MPPDMIPLGCDSPVLALDIGESHVRALFYVPGAAPLEQVRCAIPLSERVFGGAFWAILHKYLGLPEKVNLANTPVIGAVLEHGSASRIAILAQDSSFNFRSVRDFDAPSENMSVLRQAFFAPFLTASGGFALENFLISSPPPALLQLYAIQRILGNAVADSFGAALLGISSVPAIAARSLRQGILGVQADAHMVRAALIFQGRVFGMFECPWSVDVRASFSDAMPALLHNLESFRLGWLPPELAAAAGGWVAVCPGLPPEAEGFKPMYICGSHATALQANGRLALHDADPAMTGCWGLINAFGECQRDMSLRASLK